MARDIRDVGEDRAIAEGGNIDELEADLGVGNRNAVDLDSVGPPRAFWMTSASASSVCVRTARRPSPSIKRGKDTKDAILNTMQARVAAFTPSSGVGCLSNPPYLWIAREMIQDPTN